MNPKTVLDPPKAEPESDGKNFKTDTFGFTDIIDPNFSDAYATMTEQNMRFVCRPLTTARLDRLVNITININ